MNNLTFTNDMIELLENNQVTSCFLQAVNYEIKADIFCLSSLLLTFNSGKSLRLDFDYYDFELSSEQVEDGEHDNGFCYFLTAEITDEMVGDLQIDLPKSSSIQEVSTFKGDYFSKNGSFLESKTCGLYLMIHGSETEDSLELVYYNDLEDGLNKAKFKWHSSSAIKNSQWLRVDSLGTSDKCIFERS